MKNIVFVCNSGLSTSLLIEKIKKNRSDENLHFEATNPTGLKEVMDEKNIHLILLTPQVRMLNPKYEALYGPDTIVANITFDDFVKMDVDSIVEKINDCLEL